MVRRVTTKSVTPSPKQSSETSSKLLITRFKKLLSDYNGTVTDFEITPELAKYILRNHNSGNRKLRERHANNFANDLKRGHFENTGEPLIFSKEGILNSGQHRLEGVARAGIATQMDIRFGIARRLFAKTDTGAKRLSGDVLSIAGSTSPYATAAAIKLLLGYERGLPGAYSERYGNDEILEAFNRWPDIEEAVDICHRKIARKGFLNASSNAFTFLAVRASDTEAVEEFLEIVNTGLTPRGHKDAPWLLRERLINVNTTRGTRHDIIERFALFIKAWEYWRKGERPNRLVWRSDEQFPQMLGVKL